MNLVELIQILKQTDGIEKEPIRAHPMRSAAGRIPMTSVISLTARAAPEECLYLYLLEIKTPALRRKGCYNRKRMPGKRIFKPLSFLILFSCFAVSSGAWAKGARELRSFECGPKFRGLARTSVPRFSQIGGRTPSHNRIFSETAGNQNAIIIVSDSNPASRFYIGKKNYLAKPGELKKCKSRTQPPFAGLVACPPELFNSKALWRRELQRLRKLGYRVEEGRFHLVEKDQHLFYSDYDLVGVYEGVPPPDAKNARSIYSEELRRHLNRRFGAELIQHPPLDDWNLRRTVGLNPPFTAFLPDGRVVFLRTREEVAQFYRRHKIDWDGLWGDVSETGH